MPRGINDYDTAMLQGRNYATADSFQIVYPGVVTSGLVVELNAGNLVSYPGNGNRVFNLPRFNTSSNSGNPYYFTVGSPTFSNETGGLFTLNGSSQGLRVTGTADPIKSNTSTSFELWINITTLGGIIRALYDAECVDSPLTATVLSYGLVINASNLLQFFVDAGYVTISTALTTNTWTHIVATAQAGSPYVLSIYVNGVKGAVSASANTNTMTIGGLIRTVGFSNIAGYYLSGKVALVKQYDRALTPTEVEQNFNATRARFGV